MTPGIRNDQEKERRSRGEAVVGYGIPGIFIVLCAYYAYEHHQDFAFVASVSVTDTAWAGFLILAAFIISVYQFGLFLKNAGLSLELVELTALTMAMCLGNLLIPMRGGTGALALYLKKTHGLDFTSFAVIYGGTGLLMALINTGLAAFGLILLALINGSLYPALSLLVGAMFIICLYLSLFPPPTRRRGAGLSRFIFEAVRSWHLLTRDRLLLLRLAISFLLTALALAGSFYFIYKALGLPLSAFGVLITSSLGNMANLIAITPGSLGIFDAVVIQIPQEFGLDPARAIAGAVLFRVLSFFWAVLFGVPGLMYVLRLSRGR
jgi:uncharacterized membrane protein YbhN (UPF0104 family)